MKINKLNESAVTSVNKLLTEDVSTVRDHVRQYLQSVLDDAFDNIAIAALSEVEDYNPDWCSDDVFGPQYKRMTKSAYEFLNAVEAVMFANAPQNEALTEAVDMSKMRYAVVKPNGEYAGVPCESVDEAREMAAQEEGRVVFRLSKVLFGESYDEEGNPKKCDNCGTLLNDMGTCPKCDDDKESVDIDSGNSVSLNENALNEGPGIRSFGRKIANKFDPAGAQKREVGGYEKDEISHRSKKAPVVLARDFTTKAQEWKFYPNVKNTQAMNFDQWMEKYKDAREGTPEYAQWYNAIVTDKDGYYIRRGSEDMSKKLQKYIPGDNDEILKMYRVEPYTYYKDSKKSPVDPEPTPEPEPDPKDSKGKKKKPVPKDSEPKKKKPPIPIADKDLNRFIQLCRLTSFKVFANDDLEKQLTVNELKGITTPTLDQYSVSTKYQKKLVNLADWMQTAKRLKFLEQFDRKLCGSLNESLVLENLLEECADAFNQDEYIEENIVMESSTHCSDFKTGEEVIEGMMGNLDDKDLDYQIRYLTKIARRLGLRRVDDLIMYVDDEWMYDPTIYSSEYFQMPTTPTNFEINGVKFIAAKEFGSIWLYFNSEADGCTYLDYCDSNM